MAKTKISEFSATAANNTDIDGINIAEGCAPSSINNAIRELMSQLKDQQVGSAGDNFTVGGNLTVTGTTTLSAALPILQGGTGQTTASGAINALIPAQTGNSGKYLTTNGTAVSWGAVAPGTGTVVSVGITGSLSGITITGSPVTTSGDISISGTLGVVSGGTGVTSMTSGAVLVGNGTSPVAVISPGANANVLTSNGSSWASTALPTASASVSGVVSTGTQTFAGSKTFNTEVTFGAGFTSTSQNFTSTSSWFWDGTRILGQIAGSTISFLGASSAGYTISDVQKLGGGTFNAYSDSRYKQDVAPYALGLDAINTINPKSYRYTAAFMHDTKPSDTFIGIVAQDLENTVFASCVKEDAAGYKIVDISQFTFALINAVKELSAKVTALENK